MSKYTVIVSAHFGLEVEFFHFETRGEVFNFVTCTDSPVAIWRGEVEDMPAENEAWDDWLCREPA